MTVVHVCDDCGARRAYGDRRRLTRAAITHARTCTGERAAWRHLRTLLGHGGPS